ncbi:MULTISPECIES: hypothetical protein [unclassified Arenibacter]|uniref:hypothetical protein n=1 Tax=unclassified Arenibacter TaxID=2615047 RepID=UPI000E345B4F|nr:MULTISPECIES: hypothetical protein [unclassified Arenibacter]MCM4162991.1 hypothetical protein [Arenibacter sp. A80]RFT57030.1 hypothetical protein D0S24_05230 [Arenibacter sp. P308M17]
MEVSEFTLKLIILLIPGAMAAKLYQRLTIHDKWTPFQFIANAILLGGVSYLTSQLLLDMFNGSNHLSAFWQNLPTKEIPYEDVLWACISAVVLGFLVSAIDHYKLLNKFAKWIKATNKYGDENLFLYFLNAQEVQEVYIRDKNAGFTYQGIIDSYSANDSTHEIVLRQVAVFEYETSDLLYELDKLYVSKLKNELTIELPFRNTKTEEYGTETETEI